MGSYEKLEQLYIETTGCEPNISFDETDHLNENSPGHLYPNDEIKLWNKLDGRDLIEAKAHEVAHIILRYQGLVAFDVADDYEANQACGDAATDLCMDINNAISHRFLIPMLDTEYGIDSILQQKLRCQTKEGIAEIKSAFPGYDTLMHIQGIVAYDILQCNFAQKNHVEDILNIDIEMRRSFDLALKYLSTISIGQPVEIQIESAKRLFIELGYPPECSRLLSRSLC